MPLCVYHFVLSVDGGVCQGVCVCHFVFLTLCCQWMVVCVKVCVCHFVFLTSIRNCGRSDALRPMVAIMRHGKVNVGRMICAIIYGEAKPIITIAV